jgi:DNA (cytosine-5)-methyltransferase 1
VSITARSYCTGYTGLEMAVRQAFGDFEVLSHSDIKPAAIRLLDHHYPDIPNLGDMKALFPADRNEPCAELEPADLFIGSWPCQPHSSAGLQLGEDDPRDLWPNYLRGIEETRPSIFFGENVARIATNGELRRVARSLASIGYVGAWRVFGAADVDACHLRKRCFVVAVDPATCTRDELLRHGEVREGAAVRRTDAPLTLLPTPTQSMTTGAGTSGRDGGLNLQTAVALLPTPRPQTKGGGSDPDRQWLARKALNPNIGGPNLATALAYEQERTGQRWGKYAAAIHRHEQALGRGAPDPTKGETRGGNPQLNPAFVEWMMMLPEGHVSATPGLAPKPSGDRNAMLSMLGDGVVPAQGAAAFSFLLDHLAKRLAGAVAA